MRGTPKDLQQGVRLATERPEKPSKAIAWSLQPAAMITRARLQQIFERRRKLENRFHLPFV
jgi:hypothetical protein